VSTIGHNSGKRLVEMDDDMIAFVKEHCEKNMIMSLNIMQNGGVSHEMAEELVELTEKYKRLKKAVENAT
jgi:aromatic ring-opening dioxygenase LigB subunit